MPQTYTVRIVDEDDWKDIVASDPRYRDVTEENLGFSDPAKRRAYVREAVVNSWPGIKPYLLQHEFEHLISDEPWHEDAQGIRHKKFFKQVVAPIALPLLGAGLLGPLGGAFGTLGTVAGAGLGAAAGGAGAAALRGGDVGRSALTSGLLGAATAGAGPALRALSRTGATVPTAAAPLATTAPGAAGSTVVPRLLAGFRPSGNLSPQLLAQAAGQPPGLTPGAFGGGATGGGRAPFFTFGPRQVGTSAAGGGNVFQQLMSGARGVGTFAKQHPLLTSIGAGAALSAIPFAGVGPQTPEVPELGQLPAIQQFRTTIGERLNPLRSRLEGLSNQPLPPAQESTIRRAFDRRRRQQLAGLLGVQPGAGPGQRDYDILTENLAREEAETLQRAQLGFQESERQNLVAQMGLSETELGLLGQLAGLDIQTIMTRTGLSAEEANQFKQVFGNLGAAVAGAGVTGAILNRFGF